MITLGTLANPNIDFETFTGEEYALMNLNNQQAPFRVTSNKDGSIRVIIGSDSGFEGATTVFHNAIGVQLTEVGWQTKVFRNRRSYLAKYKWNASLHL